MRLEGLQSAAMHSQLPPPERDSVHCRMPTNAERKSSMSLCLIMCFADDIFKPVFFDDNHFSLVLLWFCFIDLTLSSNDITYYARNPEIIKQQSGDIFGEVTIFYRIYLS